MPLFGGQSGDQTTTPTTDVPWLLSAGARGVGSIAGILSMVFGLFNLITLDSDCLISGLILILEGFAMTLIEAPCLCICLDFASLPSKFFENRPHWIRAVMYMCFAGSPFFFCVGATAFIDCALIFFTAAIYLIMSLGKKASVNEMRVKATLSESPSSILVMNEVDVGRSDPPTKNMTFTSPPPVTSVKSGVIY